MFHCLRLAGLCLGLSVCGTVAAEAQQAHFTVRSTVINPDLPAFDATIEQIGNGWDLNWGGGGFEPSVFRNLIIAAGDSDTSVIASPEVISGYDSWPDGAFDGADIEVMRIVDGAFVTVRRDTIPKGGFHASGWLPVLPSGQVIPREQTRYIGSWENYNRLDAPWYYTVRAVDGAGNLSPAATPVAITPAPKPGKLAERAALTKMQVAGGSAKLPAPDNLQARLTVSQTLMLSWDPVPGAAGYVVFRSDLPPDRQRGYGIALSGKGAMIRTGDMVFLRKKFLNPTRAQVATSRVWNAYGPKSVFGAPLVPGLSGDADLSAYRLVPHAADTPVQDPGETFLQADLQSGQQMLLGMRNHSGTEGAFYPVLDPSKTYRIEIWLRAEGNITARFDVNGVYRKVSGLPVETRVGATWRKYSVDFRVPDIARAANIVGTMGVTLSGSGRVEADNLRMYRADTPFMDILPEDGAALADSGMGALRTHMFVRTGTGSYDLAQLTDPAGVNPRAQGSTLPQVLGILSREHVAPWLQIEPHFSTEEWLGLAEYLAAPFDPAKDDAQALPWAAKRAAQGHPAPWTDDFDKIYFEIGNETWNRLFSPWIFPSMADGGRMNWTKYSAGQVYGLYQEHVLDILRSSPWWDRLAPRLEPVVGGWLFTDYGLQAMQKSPGSRVLTNADYIGGWDAGEGPVRPVPEGYASVMVFTPQTTAARAANLHAAVRKELGDRDVVLGTYEAGPGYAKNGLNGQRVTREQMDGQEQVMKSAAAGVATLDNFLTRAQAGDRIQNFFTFGRGLEWKSHAPWFKGGQAYPSWDWLALFNRVGRGDVLAVDTIDVPRRDVPDMGRRKAMADVPMAAVYAARKDDRLTVTVISRAVPDVPAGATGRMSVQIDLPITGATGVMRYRATGDYRAQNLNADNSRIEAQPLPLAADVAHLSVPDLAPASAEIYVFDGVTFAE